jgi:hypothetical protein
MWTKRDINKMRTEKKVCSDGIHNFYTPTSITRVLRSIYTVYQWQEMQHARKERKDRQLSPYV